MAWVLLPLVVASLLNAAVRPWLASQFGGVRIQTGSTGVSDGWWEFDSLTRTEHPALTWFLSVPDGLLAIVGLVLTVCMLAAIVTIGQRRAKVQR